MVDFNPWVPQPANNPWAGSPFDPVTTGKPYYNVWEGAYKGGIPVMDAPEKKEEDEIVKKAVQKAKEQSNDREEQARIAHAEAVAQARKKWGANAPPMKIPGILGAISELLGVNETPEGWVEGNELTDGYWERNPLMPGSPLPGVGIAEFRRARNTLGVTPTGRPGRSPGDFDPVSGGVFNQFGVAVDPDTGDAVHGAGGTASYASFKDWQNVMAAGSASGWRGGILTEKQKAGLSEKGHANYQKFQAELAKTTQPDNDDDDKGPSGNSYSIDDNRERAEAKLEDISSGRNTSGQVGFNYGGLIEMNMGGNVMMNPMIAYRQEGGIADDGSNVNQAPPMIAEKQPMDPMMDPMAQGMAPPMDPMAAGMPPEAPMAPPAPVEPPRRTFADRVDEALMKIRGGKTSVPTEPLPSMGMGMMDGQGDGPVTIYPGAGELTQGQVGPDMGVDTVDADLEEGSFVLNPEASDMFAEDVQMMVMGGRVNAY